VTSPTLPVVEAEEEDWRPRSTKPKDEGHVKQKKVPHHEVLALRLEEEEKKAEMADRMRQLGRKKRADDDGDSFTWLIPAVAIISLLALLFVAGAAFRASVRGSSDLE